MRQAVTSLWATPSRALTGLVTLLATLTLFALGAWAVRSDYRAESAARLEGTHARARLIALSALQQTMLEAESAERGWIIARRPADLAALEAARDALSQQRTTLEQLMTRERDPAGAEAARQVGALAEAQMDRLAATVASYPPTSGTAAAENTGEGLDPAGMGTLRAALDGLREAEAERLTAAYGRADQQRRRAQQTLALVAVLTLGLMALSVLLAIIAVRDESRMRYLRQIEAERDRADLVSRELSHRVRNLFAVIMSIVSVTARHEPDARIAAQKTRMRIQALAHAHEIADEHSDLRTPLLGDLIESVVRPYCPSHGWLERAEGPAVMLPARLVTPLALIFNEMATNSLKFGCWSTAEGTLRVSWAFEVCGRLSVTWTESGQVAVPPPGQTGFGTTMVELLMQQTQASMHRTWGENGLIARLELRLSEDETTVAAGRASKDTSDGDA